MNLDRTSRSHRMGVEMGSYAAEDLIDRLKAFGSTETSEERLDRITNEQVARNAHRTKAWHAVYKYIDTLGVDANGNRRGRFDLSSTFDLIELDSGGQLTQSSKSFLEDIVKTPTKEFFMTPDGKSIWVRPQSKAIYPDGIAAGRVFELDEGIESSHPTVRLFFALKKHFAIARDSKILDLTAKLTGKDTLDVLNILISASPNSSYLIKLKEEFLSADFDYLDGAWNAAEKAFFGGTLLHIVMYGGLHSSQGIAEFSTQSAEDFKKTWCHHGDIQNKMTDIPLISKEVPFTITRKGEPVRNGAFGPLVNLNFNYDLGENCADSHHSKDKSHH